MFDVFGYNFTPIKYTIIIILVTISVLLQMYIHTTVRQGIRFKVKIKITQDKNTD